MNVKEKSKNNTGKRVVGLFAGIMVFVLCTLLPTSQLVSIEALRAIGLLLMAVIWILFGTMPEYLAMLSMCVLLVVSKTVGMGVAFGTYAKGTWWLMIGAFAISIAATESGLLTRIALQMMKIMPPTFRGQVLGFIFSGVIASPIIPSSTAKAVIASGLAKSTSEEMGFAPGSKGARGLFVAMFTGYISVALGFLSGSAVNPSIIAIMPEGFEITWTSWFIIALPWVVISTALMIFCIFKFYTPEDSKEITKNYVNEQIEALGPMGKKEKTTLFIVLGALVLWILEPITGINSAMVAVAAFILLVTLGIFDSKQWRNQTSWESLIFVGSFLCLPDVFAELGINEMIKVGLGPFIQPLFANIFLLIIFVSLLVYVIRLVMVSLTGTTILVATLLIPFALQAGIHPFIVTFIAYVATNTWNVSYQNTTTIAAIAATDGKMVTFPDIFGGSVMYMVTTIVASCAAVPVWKLMGLIP